jgi:ABC-type Fe3+/spermidine/putrescine transport system ATPase subunit
VSQVIIESLVKKYGKVVAVDDVSLEVQEGEFLTLLGPSGCGKTTTLRCVAGLEKPDSGRIYIGGKLANSTTERIFLQPEKRDVGMVFQSYAIWPNMTVFDNVAFGLSIRKATREKIEKRVGVVLKQVKMEEYATRYATELSGGQQQRVAVARALAFEPRALLFDEPLSNLDAKLREDMRIELVNIQKNVGISALYVTHDQTEAMAISDRIAVMDKGKIVQMGTPEEIYNKPINQFVAEFIGTTNLVTGQVVDEPTSQEGMGTVSFVGEYGAVKIRCPFTREMGRNGKVVLSLRTERIATSLSQPENRENVFPAKVIQKTFLGDSLNYYLNVGGHRFRVKTGADVVAAAGQDVFLSIQPKDVIVLPPE